MAGPIQPLIKDISLTLSVAGVVILLAQQVGLPLVVAYLISGMLIGPTSEFLPVVVSLDQIRLLSELGILFLLFGLGLEFSFRKLFRLGFGVIVIGLIEVSGSFFAGYLIGDWLGLIGLQKLILGFIFSISSTGVIVKILQEKKLLNHKFAQTIVGILIVEDLFAIFFLFLITILKEPNLSTLFSELGILFSVSTLWIVGGTIILPSLVKKLTPLLTDEVLTISSLGFCLGFVVLADQIGVSSALAAFLCGTVFAETDQQHRIEEITRPVRQFFTAIFFVAMGMLVNPKIIFANLTTVLIIALGIFLAKTFLLTFGALFAGRSLSDSLRISLKMGQIGEFSIIIATLGVTKGFLPLQYEGIIVGSATVLILLTGLVAKYEKNALMFANLIIPKFLIHTIEGYRYSIFHFERGQDRKKTLEKIINFKTLQNLVIILAIFLATKYFILSNFSNTVYEVIFFTLSTVISAPFLYSVSGINEIKSPASNSNLARRVSVEQIAKLVATLFFYMMVAFMLLPDVKILFAVALLGLILSFAFSHHLHKANTWVFKRLANEDRILSLEESLPKGGPWDENLRAVTVHPLSIVIESTLFDLDLRNKFGVNVILHQRGNRRTVAPLADTKLYPQDILLLMGSSQGLDQVEKLLTSDAHLERAEELQDTYIITSVFIEPGCTWDGKTLGQLNLQSNLRAVVVAIERKEHPITDLNSSTKIEAGDVLWIAMERSKTIELANFTTCSH